MKGIIGSSHGNSKYRGGRRRGTAKVNRPVNKDERFASRFTDPRFKLSKKLQSRQEKRYSPQEKLKEAVSRDPRFSKKKYASEKLESEDAEESLNEGEDGNISSEDSGFVHFDANDEVFSDEKNGDDDACEWIPGDVEFTEATHRLAVVNCDWDHIRAVDLYAILFHALPLGGQLKDVCVYMSEFGKKMIEHERVHGPDLWVKEGKEDMGTNENVLPSDFESEREYEDGTTEDEEADSESPDDDDDSDNGWIDDNPNMLTERGEDGEFFSSGKYRQYEMNRMKYYYAIATFDSAETAFAVYRELDGIDIESSGVVLDLRYVGEDETFEDPVNRADSIPPHFKPLSSFKTAALSEARFRIAWDQDDLFRYRSVQDSFTGTTAEDDLAAYLAPPDSDDDEMDARTGRTKAEEKMRLRQKYASLLAEIGKAPDQLERDSVAHTSRETSKERNADDVASVSVTEGYATDDDSLNQLSDLDGEDELDSESNDTQSGVEGNLEATVDFDADSKAVTLQREAKLRKMMKEGSLGARAELKYKLRRKAMKKVKKEELLKERKKNTEAFSSHKMEQKEKLKALIGTEDNGAVRLSRKERQKQHAKEVKEALAKERAARKQSRIATEMGLTNEARSSLEAKEAEQAKNVIDTRFQSKLLSDPRYHLEVAQKDKNISKDVAELASIVAKARRAKRSNEGPEKSSSGGKGENQLDSTVDFFLAEPFYKKKKKF